MKKFSFLSGVILLFLGVSFLPTAELAQQKYSVMEELDVRVPMRDGIRLSTNIYRPKEPGKYPVLLSRSPYGNGGAGNKSAHLFVERGYVYIAQDVRGRFESEGIFYPLFNETADGLDTHAWIAKQPWSNGKIGTFGGSYVGMTQWLPAIGGSPHLVSMFPSVPFIENYTVALQNGAFRMRMFTIWYSQMTAPYDFKNDDFMKRDLDAINRSLPLLEQDVKIGWRLPLWRDMANHPENDSYWEPLRMDGKYANVRAAVYTVIGWYDLFTAQNLKSFVEMTKPSMPFAVRSKQKMIIGPWAHGTLGGAKLGDLDFGKDAAFNTGALMLRWFDATLKGIDNGILKEPPVKIFVMGENVWRDENEWPLKRTVYTKYYFHSDGHANSKNGNGSLSVDLPKDEPPDRFVYDPENPVPSSPDGSVFDDFKLFPIDHSRLEDRPDILVFSTPPLERDVEVTGPLEVVLHASSSAVNTDFTGKLLDVYPDGKAIYIRDGIIRASFRNGPKKTSNIEPGKVYEYRIDLWATSNVFRKGHRIRVDISSSNFPRFDRNLNTGGNPATETKWVKAEQTIYHSKQYPSCIILPIIPTVGGGGK
ncbi:MAG: CocE/NonD family hydrolase [Candidatus Latescibacterota bacterium]